MDEKPDCEAILAKLKDFQRRTADYVFRRLYLDDDRVQRFLIADEVGLGKTLVAKGVIAHTIDHLWNRESPINIVYVCSSLDIARQNIARLNVTGYKNQSLASRITLLPIHRHDVNDRINFIAFTPGTSLNVSTSSGWSTERELLFHLLKEPWGLENRFNKATRVLEGSVRDTTKFRDRVRFFNVDAIHPEIAASFASNMLESTHLRTEFDDLCELLPRANVDVPEDLRHRRTRLIGDLRQLLARTCLKYLKPDLIILDEFQRFKQLLSDDESDDTTELARHLFKYQADEHDKDSAARVLLLSATPYALYSQNHATGDDHHHDDFWKTIGFLEPDADRRQAIRNHFDCFREELLSVPDHIRERLLGARSGVELALKRVMVRTEKLALSADRNGLLETVSVPMALKSNDLQQYLALQRIARVLEHDDVMEYWKSAPFLLNFMDEYHLKRRFTDAIADAGTAMSLGKELANSPPGWLRRKDIEGFRAIDPANARLRALAEDTIDRGAWRLLWVPPSRPYYTSTGEFNDPKLRDFTKRLVFSSWRVVPKVIAAFLSYESERQMYCRGRKKPENTREAQEKRKPRLVFNISKGRLTGMPVLGLIYPCRTLARHCDPLTPGESLPTYEELFDRVTRQLEDLLNPLLEPYRRREGPPDEAWYWAATIKLDLVHDSEATRRWFDTDNLAALWAGQPSKGDVATGWSRHVDEARRLVDGSLELGSPPKDLISTLALLAIGGPGIVALRALERVLSPCDLDLRMQAAPLAHAFLHLFNLPEVIAMLRDRSRETPYWKTTVDYCARGNLQAVMDEYGHIVAEAEGAHDGSANDVAEAMARSLMLRTSTIKADLYLRTARRVRSDDSVRMRSRFAMRFGDQEKSEDASEPTRADQVRAAFNSPFWPFVLATTSVGQEGLDFHSYCHAVVHWNLPSNPVDLEQREGRVHRYKGHAIRKNVATGFAFAIINPESDPWAAMFAAARQSRSEDCDLFAYWLTATGSARIQRHVPSYPHSRDHERYEQLQRSLVLYRMVFGQNRQDDLVRFLSSNLSDAIVQELLQLCRINLSP